MHHFPFTSTNLSLMEGHTGEELRTNTFFSRWFLILLLWVKKNKKNTLKDESPAYLHQISGSAQGLAATATLPQRCHLASCFAACPIYLFIRPSSTHNSLLISPIKINPHLKISALACNRGGDGLPQSLSVSCFISDKSSSDLTTTSEVENQCLRNGDLNP